MNSYVTPLPFLGVIKISGEDAREFLHNQLTSDIAGLGEGQSTWSAWCHANGRVIVTFLVTLTAGHYYLVLPANLTESVCKRLKMFVLRAKVRLDDITNQYGCIGVHLDLVEIRMDALLNWDFSIVRVAVPHEPAREIWITARNEMPSLFSGFGAHGIKVADEQRWQLQDIVSGIAWIHASTSEQVLPQELNLETLGGLSYEKGCYPGQEVIARLHFRGQQKRLLCHGSYESAGSLPAPGTKLTGASAAQSAGLVLASAHAVDNRVHLLILVDNTLAGGGTVTLEDGTPVPWAPIIHR